MSNTNRDHSAKKPNRLIHESSPYLLQHACNPVDWHAWNEETLEMAKSENKILLISIGYSACHWCHVMERESFENPEIARVMNSGFICVKVDREERPDVDAVYMSAVQLIHGNGGWPLNCFALPDGRPFYGGTYYQPDQWLDVLNKILTLFNTKKSDLMQQAERLTKGINSEALIKPEEKADKFDKQTLLKAYKQWMHSFDHENGGFRGAPKFPMPNNFSVLWQYYFIYTDEKLANFLNLTLNKMSSGGIYDQIGGGFARYAVDAVWKVPHFEKMLYDNAQLISLFAGAFKFTGNTNFLKTATETADFVLRELTSPEGLFYSALDADSEGEEGKFYVWTEKEFSEVLGKDAEIAGRFFGINEQGFWEKGKNILLKTTDEKHFAERQNIDLDSFHKTLEASKQKLYEARSRRVPPGLDDKSLTAWNSLMIKALVELYVASQNLKYLTAAKSAAAFLVDNLIDANGAIMRNFKNGKATINGFLEDYSFTIEALLELYQVSGDEALVEVADGLAKYAISNFYDEADGLFWFTDKSSHRLVARNKEIIDNVIPSSNSSMGIALLKLAKFTENNSYLEKARHAAAMMQYNIRKYPTSFSNWALLWMYLTENFYEVVLCGEKSQQYAEEILRARYPGKIVAASARTGGLPLFRERFRPGKTMIYVCSGNVCKKPVESPGEAIRQLNGK
jgi:uncharacterized protein